MLVRSAVCAAALLAACVSAVSIVRDARVRGVARGPKTVYQNSPIDLATKLGSGATATLDTSSGNSSCKSAVALLTGAALPSWMTTATTAADGSQKTSNLDFKCQAAKVPGDPDGTSRWVFAFPTTYGNTITVRGAPQTNTVDCPVAQSYSAACDICCSRTYMSAYLPSSASAAMKSSYYASYVAFLQVEVSGGSLVSYTVYGGLRAGDSSPAFPGAWLGSVSITLAAPMRYFTVATADNSIVTGTFGTLGSALLGVYPADTMGALTNDASGLGSTLRTSTSVTTTLGSVLSSAASFAGLSSDGLSSAMAWANMGSMSLTANLSTAIYSSAIAGSATSVATAAATGALTFGMRTAATTTLGANKVKAEVEVVVALLGSGGINPTLANLLATGSPTAVAQAMADAATSSATDFAAAAATSASSSAVNSVADGTTSTLTCFVNAAVNSSIGGASRRPRGAGSNKCLPRRPTTVSAKAALTKALAKAKSWATAQATSTISAVLDSIGTAPAYQPVVWVGLSMRVTSLAVAWNAVGVNPGGSGGLLNTLVSMLTSFMPTGVFTATIAVGSDDADLASLPADIVPNALALLGTGTAITKGLVVQFTAAPPAICGSGAGGQICELVKKLVNSARPLRFKLPNPADAAAGMTATIEIDDIPISSRVTLQSVVISASLLPKPSVGIAAYLSLQVQGGKYLLLGASISEGLGALSLGATMIGTWQGAFGWPQLDVSNLALSTTITLAIPPVPTAFQFTGSAAVYKAGVAHDGCLAGGATATAQQCLAFSAAVGYAAEPVPTSFFYASLTSVQLGAGLKLGSLPCIFANACLGDSDPLAVVLNSVSISAATVSLADAPQTLPDGTAVPMGFSFNGAAEIGALSVQAYINVNVKGGGSATVAAKVSDSSVNLVFAGGFAAADPSASFFYASYSMKVNIVKLLCKLGKLCALGGGTQAVLGGGTVPTVAVNVATSAAVNAQSITLAGSSTPISIPAGISLAAGFNFFNFIGAQAAITISRDGTTTALVALSPVKAGGIILCRAASDCSAGPSFQISLGSTSSIDVSAYANLFNKGSIQVSAYFADGAQRFQADSFGIMGGGWSLELAMVGPLGKPSSITLALALRAADLSDIEGQIGGFFGDLCGAIEAEAERIAAELQAALEAARAEAQRLAEEAQRAAEEAARKVREAAEQAAAAAAAEAQRLANEAERAAAAAAAEAQRLANEAQSRLTAAANKVKIFFRSFRLREAAMEGEAAAGDDAPLSFIEMAAAVGRERPLLSLTSIRGSMTVSESQVSGGFDPSASISLSVSFTVGGQPSTISVAAKLSASEIKSVIVPALQNAVRDLTNVLYKP